MAEKEEKKTPPKAPSMKCLHQYIRDLSFENIAAQKNLGIHLLQRLMFK